MEGEFMVREFIAYKTAVRVATLLLGTLSIDSAAAITFLRKHPRIARGYSQQNLSRGFPHWAPALARKESPTSGWL
jgi:hypothetical protein